MSRRSKSKAKMDSPELQDDAAEVDEEQEVTRCVCGRDELTPLQVNGALQQLLQHEYGIKVDLGLFIQCDECSVWQHGYCVGLFTDADVPDKYWCERCRPELHVAVPAERRTLYRLANETRTKLLEMSGLGAGAAAAPSHAATRRSPSADHETRSSGRKDRRRGSFDEDLEKALRESARESAREAREGSDARKRRVKEEDAASKRRRGAASADATDANDTANESEAAATARSEVSDGDLKPSTATSATSAGSADAASSSAKPRQAAPKRSKARSKSRASTPAGPGGSLGPQASETPTKEALASQPSKPRFVSAKSSIYELRKRTGAILEWLGRLQLELEEEKALKVELFLYQEGDSKQGEITASYDRNLALMAALTEKILGWEQKFGKYAP
jgi:hypothetical protein